MSPVRLFPEAVNELAEAAEWYAARRPGLELDFLDQKGVPAGRIRGVAPGPPEPSGRRILA